MCQLSNCSCTTALNRLRSCAKLSEHSFKWGNTAARVPLSALCAGAEPEETDEREGKCKAKKNKEMTLAAEDTAATAAAAAAAAAAAGDHRHRWLHQSKTNS